MGDKGGLRLHPREALVVFDLDGTLLRGPTICEVLAESLGRLERMRQLERFTDNQELRAAREEMAGWYLSVGLATLRDSLKGARLAPGTEKGLALLRSHGVVVAIASITWSFAVEYFALNSPSYLSPGGSGCPWREPPRWAILRATCRCFEQLASRCLLVANWLLFNRAGFTLARTRHQTP